MHRLCMLVVCVCVCLSSAASHPFIADEQHGQGQTLRIIDRLCAECNRVKRYSMPNRNSLSGARANETKHEAASCPMRHFHLG
ncbi:hypothetical protein V8C35DRAFT_289560 [Trichoderma chlorosporum]